ncbi:MAG: hypothetical protein JRH11_25240, partial [Deltaproteobacteria bacterium]|nr:hypothetical protein [Deltaproteobacteria bacterium]
MLLTLCIALAISAPSIAERVAHCEQDCDRRSLDGTDTSTCKLGCESIGRAAGVRRTMEQAGKAATTTKTVPPQASPPKPTPPTPAPRATPTSARPTTNAGTHGLAAIAACQLRCEGAKLAPRDQAFCKLSCLHNPGVVTTPATTRATAPKPGPIEPTRRGARATAPAAVHQPSPPAAQTTSQSDGGVEQTVAACQVRCDGSHPPGTDRSTCRLNCTATRRAAAVRQSVKRTKTPTKAATG